MARSRKSKKPKQSGDSKLQTPAAAGDGSSKDLSRAITPDAAEPSTWHEETDGYRVAVPLGEPLPPSATPSLLTDTKSDEGLFAPPPVIDGQEEPNVEGFVDTPSATNMLPKESSNNDFEGGFLSSLLKGTSFAGDNNITIAAEGNAASPQGDTPTAETSARRRSDADVLEHETTTSTEEDTTASQDNIAALENDTSPPDDEGNNTVPDPAIPATIEASAESTVAPSGTDAPDAPIKRVAELEAQLQASEEKRKELEAQVCAAAATMIPAGAQLNTDDKRVEDLEEQLQKSEDERKKLESLTKELRARFTEAQGNFEDAVERRRREQEKYADRSEDCEREATDLRKRIKTLQDQLDEARAWRAQARSHFQSQPASQPPSPAHDAIKKLTEDLEDMSTREKMMAHYLAAERRRSARLEKQMSEGLPVVDDKFEGQTKGRVRALLVELKKTRAALEDSQKNLRLVRAENNRLTMKNFPSAKQLLEHYGRLLDPQSQLYATVHAMAAYRDGTGEAPSLDQREDFMNFRMYLEERANVLREAMTLPDPKELLKDFDDRWAEEALKGDWGATVTLRLSATRAATALRYQADTESTMKEMRAKLEIARARNGSLSAAQKVFEIQDELQKAPAKA